MGTYTFICRDGDSANAGEAELDVTVTVESEGIEGVMAAFQMFLEAATFHPNTIDRAFGRGTDE